MAEQHKSSVFSMRTAQTMVGVPHRWGRIRTFYYNDKGIPAITLGEDLYSPLTVIALILLLSSIVSYFIRLKSWLLIIPTYACMLAQLTFWIGAWLKNPGIVSSQGQTQTALDNRMRCPVCDIVVDAGIYHCKTCDVCCYGYDHHCQWLGKCVGQGNLRQFNLFIKTSLAAFILSLISILS